MAVIEVIVYIVVIVVIVITIVIVVIAVILIVKKVTCVNNHKPIVKASTSSVWDGPLPKNIY